MITIVCEYCGEQAEAERRTKRFCSRKCSMRNWKNYPTTRECRHCSTPFQVLTRADANRQHCSKECAKNHNAKRVKTWQMEHPETLKTYRANYLARRPGFDRQRWNNRRGRIIELLGGECCVCGANNPLWLHVDFIPGSRGLQYRHPRHYRYVSDHLDLFRLLCANHHYELTLTGRIEGTNITQ